jgi:hypothetical protein
MNVLLVAIIGERKTVVRIEPAMVGVAALGGVANDEHACLREGWGRGGPAIPHASASASGTLGQSACIFAIAAAGWVISPHAGGVP